MTSWLSAREKGLLPAMNLTFLPKSPAFYASFSRKDYFFTCNRGVRFVNVLGDETKRLFLLLY